MPGASPGSDLAAQIRQGTTPAQDLEAISKVAHDYNMPLIVDSTFSTPYLTKCFDFGADIIVTSLTKWLGGHGTGVGGMCIEKGTSQGNPPSSFRLGYLLPFCLQYLY